MRPYTQPYRSSIFVVHDTATPAQSAVVGASSPATLLHHDAPLMVQASAPTAPPDINSATTLAHSQHHQPNQKSPHQPLPLSPRDPNTPVTNPKRSSLRKPSPRLLERLHLLSSRTKRAKVATADQAPGRIDKTQLQQLEDFHRSRQIVVDKRGTSWTGQTAPQLGPEILADGGLESTFSMAALMHESDASSIISVSDRLMPSDSEPEPDPHTDTQKYRLPDIGKSRGSSRNGFMLDNVERERGPTPPPKDNPRSWRNSYVSVDASPIKEGADSDDYFKPGHLGRTASIYTLSRASFTNQISQLTSIRLPPATSLASSIAAIPTSSGAIRALNEASGQIRIWITKVTEVLEGLDAEDDIEWAAAGGRDGLGDVDAAINRFEGLIDVYVTAIEQLETREDITNLASEELQGVVDRMERILKDWQEIKNVLQGVKMQVELAMEWEELWNTVLGEIGQEVEALSRLIFEMEERRHRGILDAMAEPGKVLDINELETIVEEAPSRSVSVAAKAPHQTGDLTASQKQAHANDDDKNLVGLFARMQPLRASLDFFPMRLSAFVYRARTTFPTGCEELEKRQEFLEAKYKKIEADAESLRKELGEDRWVIIFRKASEKALRMCESVERSIAKLRESLEDGVQHTNPPVLAKKLESYEAKKEHYGPAIQQVLGIIDRGVQTRLTVNGEILRLQGDMRQKWMELEANIKGMDFAIEQLQVSKIHHQLRDSISTILSEQRSVSSSMFDTPGSSPASSVVLLSRQSSDQGVSTPYAKSRAGSFASSTTARSNPGKRLSSLPTALGSSTASAPRKTPLSRSSVADLRPVSGVSARLYTTPTPSRSFSRAESRSEARPDNKPRWNSSTNLRDTPIGHNFKPLSATTPSPYRKSPNALDSPWMRPHPSPLGTSTSELRPPSALGGGNRPPSALAGSRTPSASTMLPRLQHRASSAALPSRATPTSRKSSSHLPRSSIYGAIPGTPTSNYAPSTASTGSTVTLTGRHSRQNSRNIPSIQDESPVERSPSAAGVGLEDGSPSVKRPNTSLAKGRRVSMLPMPTKRTVSSSQVDASSMLNGRASRAGVGRRTSMFAMDTRATAGEAQRR